MACANMLWIPVSHEHVPLHIGVARYEATCLATYACVVWGHIADVRPYNVLHAVQNLITQATNQRQEPEAF